MTRLPAPWKNPFSFLLTWGKDLEEFDRAFDSFDWMWDWGGLGHTDIYVKDKTLIVETELPGAQKEDVHVYVEDDRLVIKGEIKRTFEVREENYLRLGRRYGAFRRVIPLPGEVEDKKGIRARFRDGILRVEVPLRKAPGPEGGFEVPLE